MQKKIIFIRQYDVTDFLFNDQPIRRLAAQYVDLAPSIHALGARMRIALTSMAPTFCCVHYRQGDKLFASPREYNYTAQDVVDIFRARGYIEQGEPLYIATG